MDVVIEALVAVLQLTLAGFVTWGGWLCIREWARRERRRAAPAEARAQQAKVPGFRAGSFSGAARSLVYDDRRRGVTRPAN